LSGRDDLGDDQDRALRNVICGGTTQRGQHQDRDELQRGHDAEFHRATTRGDLHPLACAARDLP
jgi:hypothetical protein